jgi:hypothetical protein
LPTYHSLRCQWFDGREGTPKPLAALLSRVDRMGLWQVWSSFHGGWSGTGDAHCFELVSITALSSCQSLLDCVLRKR